jgi:hypothetical protein
LSRAPRPPAGRRTSAHDPRPRRRTEGQSAPYGRLTNPVANAAKHQPVRSARPGRQPHGLPPATTTTSSTAGSARPAFDAAGRPVHRPGQAPARYRHPRPGAYRRAPAEARPVAAGRRRVCAGGPNPPPNGRWSTASSGAQRNGARWKARPQGSPSSSTCWRRMGVWEDRGTWHDVWRAFVDTPEETGRLHPDEYFAGGRFAPAQGRGPGSGEPSGNEYEGACGRWSRCAAGPSPRQRRAVGGDVAGAGTGHRGRATD